MNVDAEPEIIFKWTNLCRLCLSSDSHIDLFSSEVISQDCLSKIRSCLNLLVYYGDPMPAKLCTRCRLKLDEWCEFRKKCIESESHVKKRLQPYKDIKFVKEYFERYAKFESSEIVSSSSKSNTGSVQNSDEVISSLSSQEYPEESYCQKEFNESFEIVETKRNSTTSSASDYFSVNNFSEVRLRSGSSEEATNNEAVQKESRVERYGSRKDWVGNESEVLGTIVSVTGSASALWDQNKLVEDSNFYNSAENFNKYCRNKYNLDEFDRQYKTCPNCELHFATEEEFEEHSCCIIGSSNNFEYDGHFEDSISFESDLEAESYLDEQLNDETKKKITPFKCLACKLYFQSSLELRRHYSSVSCLGKKVKALNCEFCYRQFLTYNDLLQHQLVHMNIKLDLTEDDLLCCGQCPLQFPNERRLKNHFLVHTLKKKQGIIYTCSFCSNVFFQKNSYENHLKTHSQMDNSSEPKQDFQPEAMDTCPPSGGPSTTVSSDPSPQDDSKKGQSAIRCFRCGQMFASVKQLEQHEAAKHKNPTPYICRKCCLRFSARSQLLMHLRVHMSKSSSKTSPGGESNEQTNCCTQCDAKFLLESDLESHMKTHKLPTSEPSSPTDQQPAEEGEGSEMFAKYKCSLCSRLYVRAASCIRHGQQSHKGEKVVPLRLKRSVFLGRRTSLPLGGKVKHKCPKCPKYFFSFNAYSLHSFRSHGLKMPKPCENPSSLETEEPRDLPKGPEEVESKCPFCSKDIKPSYISLHIKKFHRGEVLDPRLIDQDVPTNSCVCRYCLKQCSTPHNRKLHESIHYPAKAQKNQCETCGQKFIEKTEYEEHTRTCKSIRCGKCSKLFFKFTNLAQHSCSGTKNDEVHKCTVCLSAFTSLDLLQIHIKNFHGKKSENSSSQPGTSKNMVKKLDRELWREESNKIVCMVGEKFYCTFCDCEFSTIKESNEHRAAHPRGNWYAVQISDSLFQCTICDKFFETRKSSLLHINYHKKNLMPEQAKPFQLSLEPEVEIFTDVQKPMEALKLRKYNCRFCGGAFPDEEDLQDHLFHMHSIIKGSESKNCAEDIVALQPLTNDTMSPLETLSENACKTGRFSFLLLLSFLSFIFIESRFLL